MDYTRHIGSRCLGLLWSVGLVGLFGAEAAGQAARDFVYVVSGAPTSGQILEMSEQGVVLEARGARRSIPIDQIDRVTFGGEPNGLTRGRELLRSGQVEAAVEELSKLSADQFTRREALEDWQVQLGLARAELALRGSGDAKAIGRELTEIWRSRPNSIHKMTLCRTLGDLSMGIGNHAGAVKFYSELTRSSWPRFQLQGSLLEARALRDAADFATALKRYQQAVQLSSAEEAAGDAKSSDALNRLARVGVAACQAELGQAAEAESALLELIRTSDDRDQRLFAAAYNALGAAYRNQRRSTDALLAHLRVHLLFSQDPAAHAEALYYLKGLWEELKRPDEAAKADQLLKSRYATSPWAAK